MFFFISMNILSLINSQNSESIRFVFEGDEFRPRGTLIICKGTKVPQNDKLLDSLFGICVLTDEKTYSLVKRFILEDTTFIKISKPRQFANKYIIKIANEKYYDINFVKSGIWFRKLSEYLIESKADSTVIKSLDKYY